MGLIMNLKIVCVATWSILKAKTSGSYRDNEVLKNGHTITVQRRFKNITRQKNQYYFLHSCST